MTAKKLADAELSDVFNSYTIHAHRFDLVGVGHFPDGNVYAVLNVSSIYEGSGLTQWVMFATKDDLQIAIKYISDVQPENISGTGTPNLLLTRMLERAKPCLIENLTDAKDRAVACEEGAEDDVEQRQHYELLLSHCDR